MPPPDAITLLAPAKLNLALAVGPPEPDGPKRGFHPITSWFVTTSLCDRLSMRRLSAGAHSTHTIAWAPDAPKATPIDWAIERDLAVRAHRLLEAHVGRGLALEMTLSKRVPVGGGLGGGSSDAAAALVGINALYSLGLDRPALAALGEKLGSDIAFFIDEVETHGEEWRLTPRPALVTGFGERIERLPRHSLPPALLLIPTFGCPTGPVYKAFDELLIERKGYVMIDHQMVSREAGEWAKTGVVNQPMLGNGLKEAACRIVPALGHAIEILSSRLGERVLLTGSGSTMFLLKTPGMDLSAMARAATRVDPTIVCVPVELC